MECFVNNAIIYLYYIYIKTVRTIALLVIVKNNEICNKFNKCFIHIGVTIENNIIIYI